MHKHYSTFCQIDKILICNETVYISFSSIRIFSKKYCRHSKTYCELCFYNLTQNLFVLPNHPPFTHLLSLDTRDGSPRSLTPSRWTNVTVRQIAAAERMYMIWRLGLCTKGQQGGPAPDTAAPPKCPECIKYCKQRNNSDVEWNPTQSSNYKSHMNSCWNQQISMELISLDGTVSKIGAGVFAGSSNGRPSEI